MKKRIVLLLTAAFVIALFQAKFGIAEAFGAKTVTVVLDPGHDGLHGGGGGNGLREESLTLKIALYCKAELEKYGNIKVYLTRNSAACPGFKNCSNSECLQARVDYAESVNADFFVSLHLDDSASPSPSGAMVIVPEKGVYRDDLSSISHKAGTLILKELGRLGLKNRGLYTKMCDDANDDDGNFDPEYIYPNGAFTDWYGIIRKNTRAGIPSVIVEHCFISNPSEASKYLKDEAMIKALGVADAAAIAEFFSSRANPFVTASAASSVYREGMAVTAKLSGCANGDGGRRVVFYVNGDEAGSAVTNANGEAKFAPVNLNAGNYTFRAVFEGDERNASAFSTGSFSISKASALISDGGTQTIGSAYAGEDLSGRINLRVTGVGGETLTGIWTCKAPDTQGVTEAAFTITGGTGSPSNYLPVTARIAVTEIITANVFEDVENGWYKDYVEEAAAKGIVNGTGNGRYEPDREVTRAEFVQMTVNAAKLPEAEPDTRKYRDVSEGDWYYGAVMRARSAGLLDGFADRDFQPDKAVTREEMACILAAAVKRGAERDAEADLLSVFVDYEEFNKAYIKDIALIYKLNIMVGVGGGKFDSKGVTTRAQAAAVQIRMLEILSMS